MKNKLFYRKILCLVAMAALIFSSLAIISPRRIGTDKRALAAEVVVFPDHNLDAAVRAAINKQSGDIYTTDLEGLTSLNASFGDIVDITGLEYCNNLTELWLDWNQISDISSLASLTSLTGLWLNYNQISDISPLSDLTSPTELYLSGNQIIDISSLSGLTNLTILRLFENQISDISPLSGLTTLTELWLDENQISDISPLLDLTSLTELRLNGNQIIDISPLSGLTDLEFLYLDNTQISDLSPLSGLISLSGLFIGNNQISDLSPLSGLTDLKNLDLSSNQINDISSLSGLTNLTTLHLIENQISDISPLSDLTDLWSLTLNNNQISDIEPLISNAGISEGDSVFLDNNPLNATSLNDYIPELEGRGVEVYYSPVYDLTMVVIGDGTTSPAEGVHIYNKGTVVDITATPAERWQFVNWTGSVADPDSASTTVTIDGDNKVTSSFTETAEITYDLTIAVSGSGSISPSEGTHTYNEGTVVDITATPDEGWQFVNWTGSVADPDSASTTVTIDGDKKVTASFTETAEMTYDLTMAASGSGAISPSEGIHTYTEGTVVNITATPAAGWQFVNWTGVVADPDSASITVTMDGDKKVTANFAGAGNSPAQQKISPDNSVTVNSDDNQIAIKFPEGSVTDYAGVTINTNSQFDALSCPSGFKVGSTCFSVDLTIDLVPGTMVLITVKYSADDLEACDGDLDKLKLARYDEDTKEWVILPTVVNTETMTLTASTDKFSTWMVLVEEDQNSTLWIWLVAIFGGIAILLTIVSATIITRRRLSKGGAV